MHKTNHYLQCKVNYYTTIASFVSLSYSDWIFYGPQLEAGQYCLGNTDPLLERCALPVVPHCLDNNVYCTRPREPTPGMTRTDINRTVPGLGWEHVEYSSYIYECPGQNWAFDYSLPSPFWSFWWATNINNITVACTGNG